MTSLTGNACSRPDLIMDVGATARRAALSGVIIRRAKSVALLMAFQRSGGKGSGAERLFDFPTPGRYAGLTRRMPIFGSAWDVTLQGFFSLSLFLAATFSFKVVKLWAERDALDLSPALCKAPRSAPQGFLLGGIVCCPGLQLSRGFSALGRGGWEGRWQWDEPG